MPGNARTKETCRSCWGSGVPALENERNLQSLIGAICCALRGPCLFSIIRYDFYNEQGSLQAEPSESTGCLATEDFHVVRWFPPKVCGVLPQIGVWARSFIRQCL